MGGKIFASLGFLFLSFYITWICWVPPRQELQHEAAEITKVYPHASWVDVEMRTDSGVLLKCHGRKTSQFCPLERFQRVYDARTKVEVFYKGDDTFEVRSGTEIIVSYDTYVKRQRFMWAISFFLLVMAAAVFTVKQGKR